MKDMLDKIIQIEKRYIELGETLSDPAVIQDYNKFRDLSKQRKSMEETVELYYAWKKATDAIEEAKQMIFEEKDEEMKAFLKMEMEENESKIPEYEERMKVLRGDDVHQDVLNLIPDFVTDIINENVNKADEPAKWDKNKLNRALEAKALPQGTDYITDEILEKWDYDFIVKNTIDKVIECYEAKIKLVEDDNEGRPLHERLNFSDFERFIFLQVVDKKWIDNVDAMDKLKRGISLRGYAQEDPVIAYKKEGLDMFEEMTASIQDDVVLYLLKSEIKRKEKPVEKPVELVESGGSQGSESRGPIVKTSSVGRNDPCPCGSGKKYKKCCGLKENA